MFISTIIIIIIINLLIYIRIFMSIIAIHIKRKFCLRANEIFEKIIYNFIPNIKICNLQVSPDQSSIYASLH